MSAVAADQTSPGWQNYVDLDNDAKPYLQIDAGVSTMDVKLQQIIDMACGWVQNYLGRPVAPTTIFRRFSGYTGLNGAYIMLPYYPVLEIVAITEYWGLNGAHPLVYQTPESQGGPGQEMYQCDWVNGVIVRTYQGLIQRPTFPGSMNIEIEWVAGYNPVPADVRIATLELVAWWWRNTQEAPRWFAVKTEYDGGPNPLWPSVPNRVTTLLAPYLQQGMG